MTYSIIVTKPTQCLMFGYVLTVHLVMQLTFRAVILGLPPCLGRSPRTRTGILSMTSMMPGWKLG